MRSLLALALMAGPVAAAEPFSFDVPRFEEVAVAAGIEHRYTGGFEHFVGGGAASFDCNGDRMADVFLAGGSSPAALYVNRSEPGRITFESADTGLPGRMGTGVTGAYPLDVDGDGTMDLAVLRVGGNVMLRGKGDCTFEPANAAWGVDAGRAWTTAFSATWEAGARFPTLAFGNYIDRAAPGSPWGTCHDNALLRPASGDTPNYAEGVQSMPGYCALSMAFTDWADTGTPALRITNDRQYYRGGQEQLWRVEAGRAAREYRAGDGWARLQIWGMGIAAADLDGDGRPEYALTSMGDTKLQTLDAEAAGDAFGEEDARPVYRDTAFDLGATAHRPYAGNDGKPSTGWHAQFADFNNDTRRDLFIAKGNVAAMPDFAAFDPDNLLLGTLDGRFHEAGSVAGIDRETSGRGAVVEDFDRDGMLDLLVVNREANVSLFRSTGTRGEGGRAVPMGNFIGIELRDPASTNRQAVGARIAIKTGLVDQTFEVGVGGGHASGQSGFVHAGLATAERVSVRVRWPSSNGEPGEWSHTYRAFANTHIVIDRGAAEPKMWFPAPAR